MRRAHPTERAVGIAHYVTDSDGVGGTLRARPEDFRVREREAVDLEPVDADPGSYPHLVVRATLRGWDTNGFAARLSDALAISRERVSWAGTKDARAVTTQLFSVRAPDLDPDELPTVADADLTAVGRTGRPVLFGDLAGNDFRIVVRDPERPDRTDPIADQLAAFADDGDPADLSGVTVDDPSPDGSDPASDGDSGEDPPGAIDRRVAVPNYFGQQRFGSRRPVTHEVGLAIVREDWERAVLAYLGDPHPGEPADTREARSYVADTRDWAGALDRFPRKLDHERSMLHALVEADAGPEPAPEQCRRALSAVPTSLRQLFVHAAQSYLFNRILSERLDRSIPLGRPVVGDVVCFADRDGDLPRPDTDRTQRVTEDRLATVRRHCERGRAFVTAPLVGTDTDLADGRPGEVERTVLEEAGLAPADFAGPEEFGSTGDRRATLVRTDLRVERSPLSFEFSLPSGSYATALLREFLKVDPVDLG